MHPLDDVAANREITQLVLNAGFEGPATRCNLLGKTETFQPGRPSDHQAAKFGVFARRTGAKVRHAGPLVGGNTQRPIEARPTFGFNLPFQGEPDFLLAARPKLEGNALSGTIPKTAADVISADDQILTVLSTSADQD